MLEFVKNLTWCSVGFNPGKMIFNPDVWKQAQEVVFSHKAISTNHHCEKKVSEYGFCSGPYFPAFGLNTEIYSVNLRIQSEYRKIGTRNNSVFEHFSRSVCVLETTLRLFAQVWMACITENKNVSSVNSFALVEKPFKNLLMNIQNNEGQEWKPEVLQLQYSSK